MSDQAWNTFLELLRAGLWEQDLRLAAVPDTAGWEQVFRLGREQAVMGVVLRGIAHLPAAQRPPEALQPVLQAWQTAFSRAAARYARVQETLLAQLHAAGLHPLVQKGCESAKYYADPSVRQAGDIDLFLLPDDFKKALELAPDARRAADGSAVFFRDGVTVELHPSYYDIHLSPARLPAPGTPCGELLLLSLAAALRRAGLLRWHTLLCSLLVADFGLDPACCLPGFRAVDPAQLRRFVRAGGNFGMADAARRRSRQKDTFGKKAATAGSFLRRLPFSLRYGARETVATMWELALGNLRKR